MEQEDKHQMWQLCTKLVDQSTSVSFPPTWEMYCYYFLISTIIKIIEVDQSVYTLIT